MSPFNPGNCVLLFNLPLGPSRYFFQPLHNLLFYSFALRLHLLSNTLSFLNNALISQKAQRVMLLTTKYCLSFRAIPWEMCGCPGAETLNKSCASKRLAETLMNIWKGDVHWSNAPAGDGEVRRTGRWGEAPCLKVEWSEDGKCTMRATYKRMFFSEANSQVQFSLNRKLSR